MRIILVGQRNGIRVVRWLQCFVLSLVLSAVGGTALGVAGTRLAGQGPQLPVMLGIIIGTGVVAIRVGRGMITPIAQLPPLT